MAIKLFEEQLKAVKKLKNGSILNGDVGSGKSITALAYYYLQNEGAMSTLDGGIYIPMGDPPQDLYIITTARKRDTLEWEGELLPFLMSSTSDILYNHIVTVDSWNNIGKYSDVKDAFFIFDEQRVVGTGEWVKSFLKITKSNNWLLLSATPGDTWQDYIPVFIANGFFKNKTEFNNNHVVFSRFSKFPKVDKYINTSRLVRLRDSILVDIDIQRTTVKHHEDIIVDYDIHRYKDASKNRWDPFKNEPIATAGNLCYVWRKIVNTHESRLNMVLKLFENHNRIIVFYNFDYELELLRELNFGDDVEIAEWNGHKHQPIPDTKKWVYLVQYTAGCEGWNCIKTDTIIFYSQNYSYKVMAQATGRIYRLNTPYKDLYYYHLKSRAGIDLAIAKALKSKKKFNETKFISGGC